MLADPCFEAKANGSPFRVLDEGSARDDLASRREVKYTLPGADAGKLRSLLDSNCRRLVYSEPVSTVRSVYFDDVRLSACHANLSGMGRRQKVRLRWYDSLRPGTDFFFEIKWRDNRLTGKHRMHLQADRPLAGMSYKMIYNELMNVLPVRYVGDLLMCSEPVAIVEYKREHFASSDNCLRVTLDYDLAYYDQTGKQYMSTSFPHRLHSLTVLEGKAPAGRESELRAMFYPFAPRLGRCSKYVHGCRLLGLISSGL